MRKATKEDIPGTALFWNKTWDLIKEFWFIDDCEKNWEELIKKSREIINGCAQTEFEGCSIKIMGIVLDHLERRSSMETWKKIEAARKG